MHKRAVPVVDYSRDDKVAKARGNSWKRWVVGIVFVLIFGAIMAALYTWMQGPEEHHNEAGHGNDGIGGVASKQGGDDDMDDLDDDTVATTTTEMFGGAGRDQKKKTRREVRTKPPGLRVQSSAGGGGNLRKQWKEGHAAVESDSLNKAHETQLEQQHEQQQQQEQQHEQKEEKEEKDKGETTVTLLLETDEMSTTTTTTSTSTPPTTTTTPATTTPAPTPKHKRPSLLDILQQNFDNPLLKRRTHNPSGTQPPLPRAVVPPRPPFDPGIFQRREAEANVGMSAERWEAPKTGADLPKQVGERLHSDEQREKLHRKQSEENDKRKALEQQLEERMLKAKEAQQRQVSAALEEALARQAQSVEGAAERDAKIAEFQKNVVYRRAGLDLKKKETKGPTANLASEKLASQADVAAYNRNKFSESLQSAKLMKESMAFFSEEEKRKLKEQKLAKAAQRPSHEHDLESPAELAEQKRSQLHDRMQNQEMLRKAKEDLQLKQQRDKQLQRINLMSHDAQNRLGEANKAFAKSIEQRMHPRRKNND